MALKHALSAARRLPVEYRGERGYAILMPRSAAVLFEVLLRPFLVCMFAFL